MSTAPTAAAQAPRARARADATDRDGATGGLHVVDDRRGHPLLWTLLSVAVLAAAVFVAVTFTAMAADGTVAARSLELQLEHAEGDYSELLAEVATLEDPARIARVAEQLGLRRADHPRQLVVQRVLPADGAGREARVDAGDTTDRLKPLLADELG